MYHFDGTHLILNHLGALFTSLVSIYVVLVKLKVTESDGVVSLSASTFTPKIYCKGSVQNKRNRGEGGGGNMAEYGTLAVEVFCILKGLS